MDLPAKIKYVSLDFDSIYIRVYSDGSNQNLALKHSQVGYVIALSDKDNRLKVVQWHSSRASRSAHSTEESELLALDLSFRSIRNMRMVVFELLKKEVPVVSYIDNQTLWLNVMKETAQSLPEVMYRCRDYISDGTITSVCLIRSN